MENRLEILDKLISTLRPDFYSQLNLPLTENEIQALEAKFEIKLPPDLKLLYQWKNGQNPSCFESFINNSMFLPLDDALTFGAELTSMIGLDFKIENWWNESWLPIFDNGGGDLICYDTKGIFTGEEGQLIEFWHADNDRNVIAPDLKRFLDVVNQCFESIDDGDFENCFHEDLKHFPKCFQVE